jgi:hypothetical protein
MWPDIREKYPDATLDICYGWDLYDKAGINNAERVQWKESVSKLMDQPGITHYGRIGKAKMAELRKQCGIWAYPTYFTEINCIGALECQRDGLVPVTMNYAALKETVGSGYKVEGDIYDPETREEFLKVLLIAMEVESLWKEESKKAQEFSKGYDWFNIALRWVKEFEPLPEDIKVSIVTPTIRKGFWNLMANNISIQTYKNVEWLIIDDLVDPKDPFHKKRQYQANKVATKYGLDVRYLRGKERSKKRTYALVNANNTGLQEAKGDLIVILQDFVLMPPDGIEQLVNLHRKNPDCLLAPVDMYVAPKVKPDIEEEDWFDGEVDVAGAFIRQNIRIENKGLRFTQNPFDYEQNYGAIPKKIAQALGGWYEFYDEGLGYDNTDLALRALLSGYKILIDETNVAVCIDHWEALKGTRENVIGRARRLNDPRYIWADEMITAGKLPLVRTEEVDNKIELLYDIPESVGDEDVVKWIKENAPQVVQKWLKEIEI